MRIATGGFAHETNGFGNILVTPEMLRGATCEGREAYEKRNRGVRTYCGGFLDEADALGIELIPTRMSSLKPSGPSTREVLEYSRDRLVELLWEEWQKAPFDAIALSMHGAGAAHGYPDLEGEFLRAIRARFGYEIPIGEPIDLHDAYVKCISDGVVVRKSMMGKGAVNHMGPTVCLVVGNVNIVVSSFRTQTFDDGPLRIAGVDWPELKVIALKSSQHFKAWWKDNVAGIISCDSPGIHSSDLSTFEFKQADTGYYPLADAKRKV